MQKNFLKIFTVVLFGVLTVVYYYFNFIGEVDKVFLTLTTFLFAIFAGFFVSRQGARYSDIRSKIANFDGDMSSIYRTSGHLGDSVQKEIGKIIENHYKLILENKAWDYHFLHKSTTITSIHQLLENVISDKALSNLKNAALGRIINTLYDLQINRKNMVELYQERIPSFQWGLIYFLAIMLFFSISSIPSQFLFVQTSLKSAFVCVIVVVVALLKQLDRLQFFEGIIGEKSAQDILDIIRAIK